MAARIERLVQDRNLNGAGAGAVSGKAKKFGAGGGRKPLGDLSNAGKPINQAGGKKALDVSFNRHLKQINASEKSLTARRKALSDISNSVVEPHVREIRGKHSLKPLREEPLDHNAIAEERMLHNHKECIKSKSGAMDVHHFLKMVGLEHDSDDDLTVSTELHKMKSESARIELEEVPEVFPGLDCVSAHPGSPEHCNTPKLSSCSTMWDEFEVDFKLIESPKLKQ
ncbi:hypothetical protein HN51_057132 [Arachis hypogaea]|uniref:Uncharacterized protein n=1 Tax=Arachis hypogaea TaxID=3818 RepID=A0A444XXB2_ARAHY|nr:uncharacterized protein LOC107619567 isoform X1 [Arachis ipaensis]XP_025679412.1 uncharacterized protein LOC112779391 [Arachis hypogaea]QHN80157.1 uncharacterized protein DS421_19g675930 [Arachis hypogaea]RYQ94065.1 hypothetical protein Ahy_B09g100264 [Arachis hypogaea]